MDSQALSAQLMQRIGKLVDGNQAKAEDIQTGELHSTEFTTQINLFWTFKGENEASKRPGRHIVGKDFGNNLSQLQKHSQNMCLQGDTDTNLRQDFLQKLRHDDVQALRLSEQKQIFHDFGSGSAIETCNSCHGDGKNTCGTCNGKGKTRCGSCSGSGRKVCPQCHGSVTTTVYINNKAQTRYCSCGTGRVSCYSCSGSGKKRCGSCSGSGSVRCSPCEGYGLFTHTHHVRGVARAKHSISTDCTIEHQALLKQLQNGGVGYTSARISMQRTKDEVHSISEHLFTYQGKSMAIAQTFTLQNKTYQCCAFSNPPEPYVRPFILMTYLPMN